MRIGLIGTGRIGAIHAETLRPLVDELLLYDIDDVRSKEVAERLGAELAPSVEVVLEASEAVVIASSAETHVPLLHRAAEAGIAAFCEKPIALDLESSWSAVEAVERAGIPVQIGFQRRFDQGYRAIRDQVATGELGTVYVLRHVSHDYETPPETYVAGSGGIYRDNLIHDWDVARYITGEEVEEVYATGSVLVADYFATHGDVDTAVAVLRFTSGTLGLVSAVRYDPVGYDVRVEVFGSKSTVAAGWNERTPVVPADPGTAPPDDPYRTWTSRFGQAYRAEMEAFLELVESGKQGIAATAHDAHQALRVAEASVLSRREGRAVRLEEVP